MANGNSGKQEQGQLVVVPGSPTGKYHVTNNFAYNSICQIEYMGEAPTGAKDYEYQWFIQKYLYDSTCELVSIQTACNIFSTQATFLTVEIGAPYAPDAKVTLTDGDFDLIEVGQTIQFTTPSNNRTEIVKEIISSTELLVSNTGLVGESSTAIDFADVTFIIPNDLLKKFHKRRWDKRALYIYG